MDNVTAKVCSTKIDRAEQLLREVLREIKLTDISHKDYTHLSYLVAKTTLHLRDAIDKEETI